MAGIDFQKPAPYYFPWEIVSGNTDIGALRQNYFQHQFDCFIHPLFPMPLCKDAVLDILTDDLTVSVCKLHPIHPICPDNTPLPAPPDRLIDKYLIRQYLIV